MPRCAPAVQYPSVSSPAPAPPATRARATPSTCETQPLDDSQHNECAPVPEDTFCGARSVDDAIDTPDIVAVRVDEGAKRRLLERLSAVASSVSSASKAVILSTPRATINIGPVTLAAATPVPYVSKWNDEKDDAVVVVRPLAELFRIDLSAFPANEAWDMRRKILNVLYRAAKMRNHPMCTGAFDEAIHMGGKAQVKWLYGGRLIMETERCSTTNKLFLRALAWPLTSAAMGRFIMDTCKTRMTDVFAPCALETSDIMHAVEPTAQHKVLCISDFESEAFAFFGNAVPYYVDEIKQACFECNASVTDIDLEDRNGDEKMNVQCIGQGDETVRAVCARLIETLGIKVELL